MLKRPIVFILFIILFVSVGYALKKWLLLLAWTSPNTGHRACSSTRVGPRLSGCNFITPTGHENNSVRVV